MQSFVKCEVVLGLVIVGCSWDVDYAKDVGPRLTWHVQYMM